MKMHHLEEDEVKAIMEKVKSAVGEEELNTDKVEEIFKLCIYALICIRKKIIKTMELKELRLEKLRALSDETRIEIVSRLRHGQELCGCDLENMFDKSQSRYTSRKTRPY